MRTILSLIIFALVLFLAPFTSIAIAAGEFTTDYDSTYSFDAHGLAEVNHEIKLKNNLAHIFTTEYTFSLGSSHASRITTRVNNVSVPATVNDSSGSSVVKLVIPHPTIGLGGVTTINISYISDNLSQLVAGTVSLNIPRISRGNEANSMIRRVRVPDSFPTLLLSSPTGSVITSGDGYVEYTFDNRDQNLSILFGSLATYSLDLTYQIHNPTLEESDTEIALPPDTPYQQMILDELSPSPLVIHLDADGNWLARYRLKAQERMVVQARLFAQISPLPEFFDPAEHSSKLLSAKDYWDTRQTEIVGLSRRLASPLNFYNYLVDSFTYDFGRIGIGAKRLGAAYALSHPTEALCTEFTDTFVALARSSGIQAREINGYAYSDNLELRPLGTGTDVLHAWPEYYDAASNLWIAVDPTWGHTTGGVDYFRKLDFSHITFVRHGLESAYPLPAGVYRAEGSGQLVQVTPVTELPAKTQTLSQNTDNGKLQIINTGNIALINYPVPGHDNLRIPYLPPLGVYTNNLTPPQASLTKYWPWALGSLLALVLILTVIRLSHAYSHR